MLNNRDIQRRKHSRNIGRAIIKIFHTNYMWKKYLVNSSANPAKKNQMNLEELRKLILVLPPICLI